MKVTPLPCEKCGHDDILIRWHRKDRYRQYARDCTLIAEHLHYTCRTCQYDWTGPLTPSLSLTVSLPGEPE